ncbi:MAG: tRNA (adenosine(37)-N6)-threonylcarbamoyltransferase complex dimerization subunit type 1 TsaB [Lachnospiraceae bacterium]|nr:tRNA (adenosine(37)-N6)-threonylcarbamoyltransferase complex dimerization subunit type 1 TsaB [Lachnospiraceae bacterium]
MRILGLDSSGMVASVAVVEDDILVAEYTTNYKKTHSQTLLPMLEEVQEMIELNLEQIDAIAIASGPGSFTGLRIGAATAKGLGLALQKPLVEVPTLEGLAYNLCGTSQLVCPLIDARRNQVYTGIYAFEQEEDHYRLQIVEPQCAVDVLRIIERLNQLNREVVFLGDGVPVYRETLSGNLRVPYTFAPAPNNRQRAASVAALGEVYYRQGKCVTAAEHQPEYLRKSQAEREAQEKKMQNQDETASS